MALPCALPRPPVHTLHPGGIACVDRDERMETLLGSCVAIILTDPRRTVGAMCHVVHAKPALHREHDSTAHGETALRQLYGRLRAKGIEPLLCHAWIYGGGNMFPTLVGAESTCGNVGAANVAWAVARMRQDGIFVRGGEYGGSAYRRLAWTVGDGEPEVIAMPSGRPGSAALINVFVVDDSAVVRQTLQHLLQDDTEVSLMGSAPNPLIAAPLIKKKRPDVLLLDIEMPGMDGLTFLRQIMAESPIPTVICSTLTTDGSRVALDALAAGAVGVVAKPRLGLKQFLEESRRELITALKAAARSRPRLAAPRPASATAAPAARASVPGLHALSMNKPVVIGSSTGGCQAIEQILTAMPADSPGIAIVQHMPEKFTAMYAQRLDSLCNMRVREAKDGDRLERGLVLIAPGGRHLQLRKSGGQYFAVVVDGPPVNRHKPSVDVLFKSLAGCNNGDALAIMLTGMGDDGARGMKQLHDLGVKTIAQDEASCVVFGMPMEAIKIGAIDHVLPLDRVASAITQFDARG